MQMQLACFREKDYERLLDEIPNNKDKYFSDDDWLPSFFGNNTGYFDVSSSVVVQPFHPHIINGDKSDTQKTEEDLCNTLRLHSAFKNLTRIQAINPYMWTYLCHAFPEYRQYIRLRWLQVPRENTIRSRFFATTPDSMINDNALSRLWWYGELTYDPDNTRDPYELTKILLTNQTLCTDVMDTLNRMSLKRIRGVLWAIRDFMSYVGKGESIIDDFRRCKKFLNHYAAFNNLEFLDSSDIRTIAYEYMVKHRKSAKSRKHR